MQTTKKLRSRLLPLALVAASTAILAALIPSVVLAARDGNTFVLSLAIPAMALLVFLDGVAIGLIYKGQSR